MLGAATLVIAAAGLALMAWDWSTPVPKGFFGIRGFTGLYAVGFGGVGALVTWRRPGHLAGWISSAPVTGDGGALRSVPDYGPLHNAYQPIRPPAGLGWPGSGCPDPSDGPAL